MTEERWLPIPNWPEYAVSDHGRIRRIAPIALPRNRGFKKIGIRRLAITRDGYFGVILRRKPLGKHYLIHTLVLTAFTRPRNPGECANHRDGNKANNHLKNLEWVSYAANARHAIQNGLSRPPSGSRHWNAKLTEAAVRRIKQQLAQGVSHTALGPKFGVSRAMITRISLRLAWKHITYI